VIGVSRKAPAIKADGELIRETQTVRPLVALITILLMIGAWVIIAYLPRATFAEILTIVGGTLLVAAVLVFAFPIRTKTATLVLTTTSGEVQALASRDIPGVEGVKLAIEEAVMMRG